MIQPAVKHIMLDDTQLTSPEVLTGAILVTVILVTVLVGYFYKKTQSKK